MTRFIIVGDGDADAGNCIVPIVPLDVDDIPEARSAAAECCTECHPSRLCSAEPIKDLRQCIDARQLLRGRIDPWSRDACIGLGEVHSSTVRKLESTQPLAASPKLWAPEEPLKESKAQQSELSEIGLSPNGKVM